MRRMVVVQPCTYSPKLEVTIPQFSKHTIGKVIMRRKLVFLNLLLAWAVATHAAEQIATISEGDFERLHALVKPQKGESPWREIAWLTNVTEARKQAAAEGKPIVIFTAADGSPLGRT